MKKLSTVVFLAAIFGLSLAGARAEAAWHRGACKADVEKFCKGVKGRSAIMKCMMEHQSELSAACKENGEMLKEKAEEAHEKCKADVEKFCKDVKPGQGRIVECLKSHESELSPECKSVAHGHHGHHGAGAESAAPAETPKAE